MPIISIITTCNCTNSHSQLSIEAVQNNRNFCRWIITANIIDNYQLTLLGIIIVMKSVDHSEFLTITTDNETVAAIGQWILSEAECDVAKEDVDAWNRHQELWQKLFSLLPESVSFHYHGVGSKRVRRGVEPDMATEIVELVNELNPGGTLVVFSSSSGGKR